MGKMLIALSVVILFSCVQEKKKGTETNLSKEEVMPEKIDSLLVSYWKSTDARDYYYKFKNDTIFITSSYDSLNLSESRESIIKDFSNKIDALYLSKSQKIIISRRESDPIVSEYPQLAVTGYKGADTSFHVETSIGEESYDIEFSKTFEELIGILDSIIPHKVRNIKSKPISGSSPFTDGRNKAILN